MLKTHGFPCQEFQSIKTCSQRHWSVLFHGVPWCREFTNFHCLISKLQMATDDLKAQCHVTVEALPFQPLQKAKSEIKSDSSCAPNRGYKRSLMAEKYLTVPVVFIDFLVWSRIKRLFLLLGTKITKSLLSYLCNLWRFEKFERLFDGRLDGCFFVGFFMDFSTFRQLWRGRLPSWSRRAEGIVAITI